MIKTRAGHTITLDDAEGREKIVIEDRAGSTITFDAALSQIRIDAAAAAGGVIIQGGKSGAARTGDAVGPTEAMSAWMKAVGGAINGLAKATVINPLTPSTFGQITGGSQKVKIG
jgi:hypothetical protein